VMLFLFVPLLSHSTLTLSCSFFFFRVRAESERRVREECEILDGEPKSPASSDFIQFAKI
jgi:hypothetical protein